MREKSIRKKLAESVVMAVQDEQDEGRKLSDQIEEVIRLGKYIEGKTRPMKIRLKSQASAEEILAGSWKLARKEILKNVWLKRDLNEREILKLNELWEKAKKTPPEQSRSGEDEILLESQRYEIKEMVHKKREEWGSKHTSGGGRTELKKKLHLLM